MTNSGGGALVVSGVSFSGSNQNSFSATPNCSSLAKGQSCTFDVFFAPTDAGALTADLTINSNGGSSKVTLTGTGAAVPPPTTVPPTEHRATDDGATHHGARTAGRPDEHASTTHRVLRGRAVPGVRHQAG